MRVSAAILRFLPLIALGSSCKGSLVGSPLEDDVAGAGGTLMTSLETKGSDLGGDGGARASLWSSMHKLASSPKLGDGGAGHVGSTANQGGSGYAGDTFTNLGGNTQGIGVVAIEDIPVLPATGGMIGVAGSLGHDSLVGSAEVTSNVESCQAPNRCPAVWITATNAGLL